MAKLLKLALRILCFLVLPIGLFSLIVFSNEYRLYAIFAYCLLGLCLAIYGRDFKGNRVLFGIRADQFERILGVPVIGRRTEQDGSAVKPEVSQTERL
jgi:hypothetical protein